MCQYRLDIHARQASGHLARLQGISPIYRSVGATRDNDVVYRYISGCTALSTIMSSDEGEYVLVHPNAMVIDIGSDKLSKICRAYGYLANLERRIGG